MYERILVTLDRSPLAEQALPHATALARTFGSALDLVAVVPIDLAVTMPESGMILDWESHVDEAREYLAGIVARLKAEGLAARSIIRRGDIAEEILTQARESKADLIVMSTHGRSGLGRWVYGSIADRVLRHATVPVLLIRATEQ